MPAFLTNPVALFTATIFTSATLMFLVELIVARLILPKFGGTPAVWNTCMVFYQAALLAGYAYAHAATTFLTVRRQIVIQVVLVAIPVLLLPITISDAWVPPGDAHPIPYLLGLLLTTVGLPFFVISTGAPLLQKWFSESGHPSAKDPYFLYAASNIGSMLALFGYPLVVEPWLSLNAQGWAWAAGYVMLAALTATCGYMIWKVLPAQTPALALAGAPSGEAAETVMETNGAPEEAITTEPEAVTVGRGGKKKKKKKGGWRDESISTKPTKPRDTEAGDGERLLIDTLERPSTLRYLHWIALAFVPSSLMLGVTTYLTTDIASLPLLWVIPLGLYLLSFIIVFSKNVPPLVHKAMVLMMPIGVLLLVFLMVSEMKIGSIYWSFALHLSTLFVVSMVCHGELARNRPAPRYLTGFYLCMSVGGVCGGLFNALVAPVVFESVLEYQIVLVVACLLLPPMSGQDKASSLNFYLDIGLAVALGLASLYALPKLLEALQENFPNRWSTTLAITVVSSALLAGGLALALFGYFRLGRKEWLDRWFDVALPVALGVLAAQLIIGGPFRKWDLSWLANSLNVANSQIITMLTYGLPVALCYGFAERPVRLGLGVACIFTAGIIGAIGGDALYQERSFFGVLKVEKRFDFYDSRFDGSYNRLLHGTTMHGQQRRVSPQVLLAPLAATNPIDAMMLSTWSQKDAYDRHLEPLTYYHRTGPIGQVYESICGPETKCNVAFIGLGTGTMASYVEPGQHATFYDIDPAVVRIAEDTKYFTYLHYCRGELEEDGKRYKIVLGDARLKMRDVAPEKTYKLIVVDAFSSDAIPIHLITKEAIEMYMSKLTDDGILAIHISNRHLRLGPVLGNIARDLKLVGRKEYDDEEQSPGKSTSDWVVLAKNEAAVKPLEKFVKVEKATQKETPVWEKLKDKPSQSTWTDDYSNLIDVLRWFE